MGKTDMIFLDFDGVLNSESLFLYHKGVRNNFISSKKPEKHLVLSNIQNFEYIMRLLPNVKVVLATNWLRRYSLDDIKGYLKDAGMWEHSVNKIQGSIPKLKQPGNYGIYDFGNQEKWLEKDVEIKSYLSNLPDKDINWLLIDDEPIMGEPEMRKRHYKTDPLVGLTIHDVFKIVKFFKKTYVIPRDLRDLCDTHQKYKGAEYVEEKV
jgi:hypothetical protein